MSQVNDQDRKKRSVDRLRDALLFTMKAAVPANAEARADFRNDVTWLCERWTGAPLCWFASKEGTAIVELPLKPKPFKVRALCARLNRLTSIVGRLFVVEDFKITETNLQELLPALEEYYS